MRFCDAALQFKSVVEVWGPSQGVQGEECFAQQKDAASLKEMAQGDQAQCQAVIVTLSAWQEHPLTFVRPLLWADEHLPDCKQCNAHICKQPNHRPPQACTTNPHLTLPCSSAVNAC